MEFSTEIVIFFIGFFSGVGILILLHYFFYSNKVDQNKETDDLISVKNNIKSIQQALQNFNLAQDRIENSLIRGGSQQQGEWGEFVLKNILDSVGLREGEEYNTQKAYKDSEGNLQKPDVIVHMPGKRDVVIDSKVSLISWHEYSNAKDESSKSVNLKKYLDSVKKFVKNLSQHNYSSLYEINTVDSVLMFMPIEPALLVLYNEGRNIVKEAWENKIIIVGPSTLPYCLKAVENMWRIDKQTKKIKDIASTATEIYEKTVNVYESFNQANQSLEKAKIKMDEAKLRLQDGPGSLTRKVQKMKDLGKLSTKKQLPDDTYD